MMNDIDTVSSFRQPLAPIVWGSIVIWAGFNIPPLAALLALGGMTWLVARALGRFVAVRRARRRAGWVD